MIWLNYKHKTIEADLTGRTLAEVRALYEREFGLKKKTAAVLNNIRVWPRNENTTVLRDDDSLVFKPVHNRGVYLLWVLLLAFGVTGGSFAYSFTNNLTILGATLVSSNFAEVSANTSATPSWSVFGALKGSTGAGTLFDIDTTSSGYTGDFIVTITMANVDQLGTIYRSLALSLEIRDSYGTVVDINRDGVADASDFVVLTMEQGAVIVPVAQIEPGVYTVLLKSGSFIGTVISGNLDDSLASPLLSCDVTQR